MPEGPASVRSHSPTRTPHITALAPSPVCSKLASFTAPKAVLGDLPTDDGDGEVRRGRLRLPPPPPLALRWMCSAS